MDDLKSESLVDYVGIAGRIIPDSLVELFRNTHVYYNPDYPEQAVIYRGYSHEILAWIAVSLVFMVIGIVIIITH